MHSYIVVKKKKKVEKKKEHKRYGYRKKIFEA